ncbi:hypothetical protein GCM10027299_44890 [Larkinella ripae]
MRKLLDSLAVLVLVIVLVVITSPPSVRNMMTTIGCLEIFGIGIIAWMATSAAYDEDTSSEDA